MPSFAYLQVFESIFLENANENFHRESNKLKKGPTSPIPLI